MCKVTEEEIESYLDEENGHWRERFLSEKYETPFDSEYKRLTAKEGILRDRIRELEGEIGELKEKYEDNIQSLVTSMKIISSVEDEGDYDFSINGKLADAALELVEEGQNCVDTLHAEKLLFEEELSEVSKQKEDLKNEILKYHKESNNLARQRGVCPFPNKCRHRNECLKQHCSHDTCEGSYTYRMS